MQTTILIARTYGGPDVLEFHMQALPPLAPGMARIAVKAAGINPIDARRMTGEFRHAALPQAFGTEFAGTIAELPADVAGWSVGDEVLGSGAGFTHASVIDVPMANLVRRPAGMDWAVAGSLAGAAQTAATILSELGDIRSLLIHGGAGGVGSILIQLAKARGGTVVATGSPASQDYLAGLGALPVVYGAGLSDRVQAAHRVPFDAAVDMAGTAEATATSLALVKPEGIIGSITGKPLTSPRIRAMWVKRDRAVLEQITNDVAAGRMSWDVSRRFPFAEAPSAYEAILTGHTRGKSVLVF